MKKIKIIGLFVLLIIIGSSCKKWIDPKINVDPNKPSDVSIRLLLPSAESALAYQMGGDFMYASDMWMQQLAGAANQPLAFSRYIYTQSDVNNVWAYGLYSSAVKDLYDIIVKAKAEGSPWNGGIAKVLMAYSMINITDAWNSVPYSQAFLGDANLYPSFDAQDVVYTSMNSLIDDAILDLNKPSSSNLNFPGSEDMIYGGDVAKWMQAAYALKARLAIHLSKKDASAYTNALAALTNAFTSNGGDLEFYFGAAYGNSNPLWQFMQDGRPGDMAVGAYLVDSLIANNDPRLGVLVDTVGGAYGLPAGEGGVGSNAGPYYCSMNSPVVFISYVELKFIEAEAKFQTADLPGAAIAFNDAVKASLAKFGVSDPAWEAIHANETGASITLEKIIKQKYFALCFQFEVYNDWRRTGFPVLQPASNAVLSQIPRRYPYPTCEVSYNSANTPSVTLIDRVWWDAP